MQRIGSEIKKTANLMGRNFSLIKREKKNLLPQMQRRVVVYLFLNGDKEIFQKDVEKHFSICRSSASGLINRMESAGIIERVPVSGDKRLKKIVLTEETRAECNNIERNIDEFESALTDGVDGADITVCLKVLGIIQENLSKMIETKLNKGEND